MVVTAGLVPAIHDPASAVSAWPRRGQSCAIGVHGSPGQPRWWRPDGEAPAGWRMARFL